MKKQQFSVEGMHCTSCAMVIESDLEDAGVKATCTYATQVLEVTYDEKKLSEQEIRNIVSKSGYTIHLI